VGEPAISFFLVSKGRVEILDDRVHMDTITRVYKGVDEFFG
jgi:hypothetical protein